MRIGAPAVLVVEDELFIRLLTVEMLEAAGFAPVEARNADEAIAILESRNDIRLVLTDIEMPGTMDGLKLAHAVRNKWPPVKLILVSGKVNIAVEELPADALFYPKPYSFDVVAAAIVKMIAA